MVAVLGDLRDNRDLAVLAGGSGVAGLGAQLTLIGFTTELAGSGAFAVAGLFVAVAFGAVLGTPLAGWALDRVPHRLLLVVAVFAQVLLPVGLLFGYQRPPVLYGLVALLGLCGAVVWTCASALVPVAVGEDGAARGHAVLSSARNAGSVAGIVLGGVIAAGPGVQWAVMLDAVCAFTHLALVVVWLRADRDPRRDDGGAAAPGGQWSGWVLLRSDRLLLGRVVAQAVVGVAVAIALVNQVFLVLGPIGGNEFTYGAVLACWSAGLLLGANLTRRVTTTRGLVAAFAAANLVLALALAAPARLPHLVVTAVAWLVAGACGSVQNVTLNGLVEARTSDAVRGRVVATAGAVTTCSGVVGLLVAGVVVGAAGPLSALTAASGFALVAALMAVLAVLRRDHLRASAVTPDPDRAPDRQGTLVAGSGRWTPRGR
ncbi:MFS transporter [Saccharothrix sp. 6-C]|uniref:MFS transporter n=1 Tax=Saccharothrix sp. 6-C TaxID=2781735 RepID=UPI0019175B8F|nr:MFS transporter [Saccharothrix sp. 6-C]QQQ79121.1 MFS transporter [Saccharothrix sp. 6-C]